VSLLKENVSTISLLINILFNMSTYTVSYSLDQDTIRGIEELARKKRFSKSDAVREIYRSYALLQDLAELQLRSAPLARELGIRHENDVEEVFG
jgi:hypothetical protein